MSDFTIKLDFLTIEFIPGHWFMIAILGIGSLQVERGLILIVKDRYYWKVRLFYDLIVWTNKPSISELMGEENEVK